MFDQITFFVVAAIILIFSVLTVTSRKILRSAVYLLFVLIATAVLYFMLDYNFLAAVQLTVYAGGIVVLIIFSILLTSHISERAVVAPTFQRLLSALSAVAGAVLVLMVVMKFNFVPDTTPVQYAATAISATDSTAVASTVPTIKDVGHALVSYDRGGFALPFEVISILLLAAMIGAIVVARKERASFPGKKEVIDNSENESEQ
ncbi:MAG TPA: NADH-quinone oxidoreductase subunit J [Prolixibacteraceae bacterium]|nr:NADH-quinone oxidoreductase subunit J [Prolixibacteraceae bacterium]HPS12713.1 NADH-quinone oxidoreductase subunit J [Prolixibacteraceae bacterium]